MVFSICCLALSGGALAVDDSSSSYGVIVDKSAHCSWNDIQWSSSTDAGVMSSGVVTIPSAGSSDYALAWTGRQVDFVGNDSKHVNFEMGTWTVTTDTWTEGIAGVSGLFTFDLIFAGRGDDYWASSDKWGFAPSSWTFTVGTNANTYTQTGSGSRASIDITFNDIEQVRGMTFKFKFPAFTSINFADANWQSNAAFLWVLTSSSIRMNAYDASGRYMDNVVEGINESNSLLGNISSTVNNVLSSITQLPSKIADAIKGLFVPTDAQMNELKASFNSLLSEKLGFVYQAGSLVDGVFDAVFDAVDNPNSDVSFTVPAFPSFDVAGTEVSLWEEPVVVDIGDNAVVQTVQQVASPFVVAVMVWGFVHSMEDAFFAFVGGKSLFDWVRHRKEEPE